MVFDFLKRHAGIKANRYDEVNEIMEELKPVLQEALDVVYKNGDKRKYSEKENNVYWVECSAKADDLVCYGNVALRLSYNGKIFQEEVSMRNFDDLNAEGFAKKLRERAEEIQRNKESHQLVESSYGRALSRSIKLSALETEDAKGLGQYLLKIADRVEQYEQKRTAVELNKELDEEEIEL